MSGLEIYLFNSALFNLKYLQRVLKINIQLKPELFSPGINGQLEKSHGRLSIYMITSVRLFYTQKMERLLNTQSGRMVGQERGTSIAC